MQVLRAAVGQPWRFWADNQTGGLDFEVACLVVMHRI
jgi:hypothetical protein